MPITGQTKKRAPNKAATATRVAKARTTLNLRIQLDVRNLIDHAAELTGKNRTDFVLDAARRAAQETLLDQTRIQIAPKAYAEFVARLDAPPQPSARLIESLQTPAVWE